jgi:hypothetical protein
MVFIIVRIKKTATAVGYRPNTTACSGSVFSDSVRLSCLFFPVVATGPSKTNQNAIIISSEPESETESESVLESHPDNEYGFPIENQLGLNRSSPPADVPADINYNELNNDGEFFLTSGL